MKKLLPLLILALVVGAATAQTQPQRGVARMITRSAKDPIQPVYGAMVTIGNTTKKSDAQGQFTLSVPLNRNKSFTLRDVRAPKGSSLILASPRLTDMQYLNAGNLVLAFTTTEDRQKYYKELYKKFYNKYKEEHRKLEDTAYELKMKCLDLEEASADYQQLTDSINKLQTRLEQEFSIEQENKLGALVEQLIFTDYQSLEAEDARIYELMCAGDWSTLSTYLLDLMDGDADAYMQEAADQKDATKALYDNALQKFALRRERLKNLIKSYKSQRLYAKAAHCYNTLIKVDSTNWENYNDAGMLAAFDMKDYALGRDYFEKALNYTDSDTIRATLYRNLGLAYKYLGDYANAEQYMQKALSALLSLSSEKNSDVASTYYDLGEIYKALDDYAHASECYEEAQNITLSISQSVRQRFIARMLTLSAIESKGSISGAKIVVNGITSEESDSLGRITFLVPTDENKSFVIDSVQVPNPKLELVYPRKGQRIFTSQNDIQLVFTLKPEPDKWITKQEYRKLLNKYNAQAQQLRELRTQLEEQLSTANKFSAQQEKLVTQKDRLQTLSDILQEDAGKDKKLIETLKVVTRIDLYSFIMKKKQRYDAAKEYYKKVLNVGETILGNDHPTTKILQEKLRALENQ